MKTIFDASNDRDTLRVVADQRGSPTSALDLADGLLRLLDRWGGQCGTYHLAARSEASWYDLACEVMNVRKRLGLRVAEIEPIATQDWPTKARRPANSVLDSGKAERDFGIRLPDWRQSVAEVVVRLAASL